MSVADKNALESIKYLWKTDDPEWVQQRKKEWRILQSSSYGDDSREDVKMYARYYVYGELDYGRYISGTYKYIFAPHTTPAEVKDVLFSGLIDYQSQSGILSLSHILSIYFKLINIPWARRYIQNLMEGALGPEYHVIEVIDGCSNKMRIASREPTYQVLLYLNAAIEFLEEGDSYDPVIDCYRYFMSSLIHSDNFEHRARIQDSEKFEILFEVSEERIENPDDSESFKFAERILEDRDKLLQLWSDAV